MIGSVPLADRGGIVSLAAGVGRSCLDTTLPPAPAKSVRKATYPVSRLDTKGA